MLPCYIIHNSSCLERYDIVKRLHEQTNALIMDAVMLPSGKDGCRQSHLDVAWLAKLKHPESRYIVFEDDCVLLEGWEKAIEETTAHDIVYLGFNGLCEHTVFGTHAVIVSPKARDLILEKTKETCSLVADKGAFDHILSYIARQHNLSMRIYSYAFQKEGLESMITQKLRRSQPVLRLT